MVEIASVLLHHDFDRGWIVELMEEESGEFEIQEMSPEYVEEPDFALAFSLAKERKVSFEYWTDQGSWIITPKQ